MKRFLLVALGTSLSTMAFAGTGLSTGARGPGTTMVSITGADTANAVAVAIHTAADEQACIDDGGQACATGYLKVGEKITFHANCVEGTVVHIDGSRYRRVGVWDNSNLFAGQSKFVDRNGELVTTVNADRGGELAVNYEDVCPATARAATPTKVSTRRVDGYDARNEVVNLASLDGYPYDHNGSEVIIDAERGVIAYSKPKASIRGTVRPGTVLFRGAPWKVGDTDTVIRGKARVFKKGCEPAQYDVRGLYDENGGWQELVLEGASPIRSKSSCDVMGATINSPNARLRFTSLSD